MTDYRVRLSGLTYVEDGEYVAICLEMDLRGYGESAEDAVSDLRDQIAMQLGFSLYKTGNLEMAFRPADPVWFERFAEARLDELRSFGESANSDYHAAGLPMPDAHVIEAIKGQYSANHV